MNWGDNLTLVGAIRRCGWVVLSTKWRAMNRGAFIAWVRRRLAPRLRRGDIVLLDSLQAHLAPEVRFFIEQRRAPAADSDDFENPIEPAWGLVKRRIRDHAPRRGTAWGRVARTARHVVTPYHCRQSSPMLGSANEVGTGIRLDAAVVSTGFCALVARLFSRPVP